MCCSMGRGTSVSIATGYVLDSPGFESLWVASISPAAQTGPEAHPASCTGGTGSLPGVKGSGHGIDKPPPSSSKVKERL